jgi:hypothetical protein
MNNKLKLAMLICVAAIALNSCKKNSSPSPSSSTSPTPNTATGTFTAKVDGQAYTASATQNTLLIANGESRMDVRATNATNGLIVTVGELDTDDVVATKTYKFIGENDDDALLTWYTITPGGGTVTEHILADARVTITSCNATTKKVSGTFSGKLFKASNDTDTLFITDGVFTDVTYSIIK